MKNGTSNDIDHQSATAEPENEKRAGFGRRRFLGTVGVAAGVAAVAVACGDDKTDSATDTSSPATTAAGGASDLAVATLAAGLEVLAVNTYQSALDAATAGKLGEVPPAVATFVTTAGAQHQEHLATWNAVLASAGKPEVTAPDAKLQPTVAAEFAKVKDATGAAKLALMLEEIAADTYAKAIPSLQSKDAIKAAGQILVVDQQHQAILNYVLGNYPVPEVFLKPDKAAS